MLDVHRTQVPPRPTARKTPSFSSTLCRSTTDAESTTVTDSEASFIHDNANQRRSLDTASADSKDAPPFRASTTLKLAVASLCCVSLAAALDATSLSIALPSMTDKLGGNAIESFWAGTSFLLTCAVFQPVIGGLSHVFGRKEMVMFSSVFFFVGSLIGGLARNFSMVLIGRTIQGVGGAGIIVLEEIIITDLIPLSVRGVWLGIFSAVWALGTVLGPLMGGGFAKMSSSGWRWIFWINLPMIGTGALAVLIFLNIKRVPGNVLQKVKRYDWIGSFLLVASLVAILVPLSWGGTMYPWTSWHTLVPIVLGIAGLIATSLHQMWLSSRCKAKEAEPKDSAINEKAPLLTEPLVPPPIFCNTTMFVFYFHTLIHGILLWSLLYFLPLYYEAIKGYSPLISGVAVLPETGLIAPVAIVIGIIVSKTGRYKYAMALSWAITVLGFGILMLMDVNTSVVQFIFLNVPVSIGTGLLYTPLPTAICATVRPQYAGHAVTFYSFIRVFGEAIGVAISGAVFLNLFHSKLRTYPLLAPKAEQYSQEATAVVQTLKNMPPGQTKDQMSQAFADALKGVWLVMMVLAIVALLCAPLIKEFPLDQEHNPEQGIVDNGKRRAEDT